MKTSDFDYYLPEELIAQTPAEPRDSSRLLVFDRETGDITHSRFSSIGDFLEPGDLLVLNETRVIPARLFGTKRGGVTPFEFLLLKRLSLTEWEVIMKPGKRLKPGGYVDFAPGLSAKLIEKLLGGVCRVEFEYEGVFERQLEQHGNTPLPPYITEKLEDASRYQTVYAKTDGSAAAPTAGLHFTPELLKSLEENGIGTARILLHVGLGTFRPMKEERVEDHVMHSEYYEVSGETAAQINEAKKDGRRVIAVGTTAVRTLESASDVFGKLRAGSGDTDIFIYPGYKFKAIDGMITNFHLPKSTLLMLVSAFAGREETLALYKKAVDEQYRFFSFGDAMFIY